MTVLAVQPKYIEIDGGVQTGPTRVDSADGTRYEDHQIGRFKFFVELVEYGGGRIGLWGGLGYEDAIREAERCRREWGIDEPVHDLIAGGRT